MKLLLHICCGPCTVGTMKAIHDESIEITGYWYNPNIHPYLEYKNRLDALIEFAKTISLPLVIEIPMD